MAPGGLSALAPLAEPDWQRPWHAPLRAAVAGRPWVDTRENGAVAHWLGQRGEAPVQFVPASTQPAGMAYEQYIHASGQVPSRDNLHDLFNGLIWLHYPATKRQLNCWQAAAIAAHGVGAVRGPVRDAITVFDENGAVLDAPPPLWQALVARQWQRLFVELRPLWAQARLCIVGHALLEQLSHAPRKNLTAHVYVPPLPMPAGAPVDVWLAQSLSAERLATKPFVPLPVMGIPGWCDGNRDASFYDDLTVFRPARQRPSSPLGETAQHRA